MKKKSLKLRLPPFFGQRMHSNDSLGNMPELIKPESGWERDESGMEDILRWADDGGKMLDIEHRTMAADSDAAGERNRNVSRNDDATDHVS